MSDGRSRDYETKELVSGIEALLAKPNFPKDPGDSKKFFEFLAAWTRDLRGWGERVRDDIVCLEAAVGAARGDPGDPPPAPRAK